MVGLFLCGDVMTGRGIDQIFAQSCPPRLYEPYVSSAQNYVELAEMVNGAIPRKVDADYIWGEALAELAHFSPDLRLINLETSVTLRDTPDLKGINYRMHPANVACLTEAGIDCCVLANNHVLDWGHAGLTETLAVLRAAGLRTVGAGANRDEAVACTALSLDGGGRVLLFALADSSSGVPRHWSATAKRPGVNWMPDLSDSTLDHLAEQVERIRQPGDLVVVSVHWGGNWGYDISSEQRHFAHGLIDREAVDLVWGHSSHHPKGIEVYRGKLLLYGCGDFINDYEGISGHEEFRSELVVMYLPELARESGDLTRLALVPLRLRKFRLERPAAADLQWFHEMLDRESKPLGARVVESGGPYLSLVWK